MIHFRCLFGEEGKTEGEIDLSFFMAARHDPSHNGLIIPVRRRGGEGMFGASASKLAFQVEQTLIFLASFLQNKRGN